MGIETMKLSKLLYPAGIVLITLLAQSALYAEYGSLGTGQPLPYLDIEAGGEISVRNNKISVSPWNSKSFEATGKVQIVHYVAANRNVARQNKPFSRAVDEKLFSNQKMDKTVIVHMADTLSLARTLVVNTLDGQDGHRTSCQAYAGTVVRRPATTRCSSSRCCRRPAADPGG